MYAPNRVEAPDDHELVLNTHIKETELTQSDVINNVDVNKVFKGKSDKKYDQINFFLWLFLYI